MEIFLFLAFLETSINIWPSIYWKNRIRPSFYPEVLLASFIWWADISPFKQSVTRNTLQEAVIIIYPFLLTLWRLLLKNMWIKINYPILEQNMSPPYWRNKDLLSGKKVPVSLEIHLLVDMIRKISQLQLSGRELLYGEPPSVKR